MTDSFFSLFRRTKIFAIWIFIALHLMIIFSSSFPDRNKLSDLIQDKLSLYIDYTGLEQRWTMFAPNPTSLNAYVEAEILFQDGTTDRWILPRPTKLNFWEIVLGGDRYCTIAERYLKVDRHQEIWSDVSNYVEREITDREVVGLKREIKKIQFYRYTNYVESPEKVFVLHGEKSPYEEEAAYYYYPNTKVRYEASHDSQVH